MVVEECEPPLSLILVMSSLQTLQVARNRWFGHVEPELEQFARRCNIICVSCFGHG